MIVFFTANITVPPPVYHKGVIAWKWRFCWQYMCMEIDAIPSHRRTVSSLTFIQFLAVSVDISCYISNSVSVGYSSICLFLSSHFFFRDDDSSQFFWSFQACYFPLSNSVCASNGQITINVRPLVWPLGEIDGKRHTYPRQSFSSHP